MNRGDIVVNVLTGEVGQIIERYHPNYNSYYADWRVKFSNQGYWVIRERHLRSAMLGEKLMLKRSKP